MHDLKSVLNNFKEATEKLFLCLEKDDIESVDRYLDDRDKIIQYINTLPYSKNEFVDICNELNLRMLEDQVNSAICNKRSELRNDIEKIFVGRNAAVSYNKTNFTDSTFFNKKI